MGWIKYRVQKQQYYSGGTWVDVVPLVTRQTAMTIYETEDECLGERWIDMPISTDWVCDECPTFEYRWVTVPGEYECSGTTKMSKEKQQYSIDSGTTWTDTGHYRTGSTVIEYNSEDCGFVPPINGKFKATYSGGQTYKKDCDSSTELTSGETRPQGYSFTSITDVIIDSCVTSIGHWAFSECKSLTSVTISDSVTNIGNQAFYVCSGLTSIDIPSGVTTINHWAFGYCSGLTSIDIPDSVTTLGNGVVGFCKGLTSVHIGSGLTTIGQEAFRYCTKLPSVVLPSSVTTIGPWVFQSCSVLKSVTCLATTPPSLDIDAFNDTPIANGNGYIYVPSGSVNAYKNATNWSNWASRITAIPNS